MIVMQYRFTLPADYDMTIIEKRIRENGAKLNGFPGLLMKAYLFSKVDNAGTNENRYAPLYIWKDSSAMALFLQSPAFQKLTHDFGWPKIDTWLTLRVPDIDAIRNNQWLTMTRRNIDAYSSLSSLALNGSLCAWDVSRWQLLQVDFCDRPTAGNEIYQIGFMASEAW